MDKIKVQRIENIQESMKEDLARSLTSMDRNPVMSKTSPNFSNAKK
jgi:hypothetical protein